MKFENLFHLPRKSYNRSINKKTNLKTQSTIVQEVKTLRLLY